MQRTVGRIGAPIFDVVDSPLRPRISTKREEAIAVVGPRTERAADRLARRCGLPRRRRRQCLWRWPRRSASRGKSTRSRTPRHERRPVLPRRRPGSSPRTSTSSRSAGTCHGSSRAWAGSGTSRARAGSSSSKPSAGRFDGRGGPELVCVPHHRAHAISAFYASGWDEAAVLVNDGNGEDESISIYEARFGDAPIRREVWPRSHSLGYLYDAACRAIGLNFLEAGKTMGLAAYGRARELEPVGAHAQRPALTSSRRSTFPRARRLRRDHRRLGADPSRAGPGRSRRRQAPISTRTRTRSGSPGARRAPSSKSSRAWSSTLARSRACAAVCLAGGVALNCSANGLLSDPLYVPPVSHDAGGALGAAWAIAPPREPQAPLSPFLGADAATPAEVPEGWSETALDAAAVRRRRVMEARSERSPADAPRSARERSATARSSLCRTRSRCATG